ncbi:hypothetical protein ABT298_09195 [Streptomyces sp. NPDC001034]|uniref:hypothetical protein n=1 Tax=Streptomyces sp. NPDC001034 TaxID=3154375 RepID=UPI00332D6E41
MVLQRDRMPDAGKKPPHQLIKQGAADGILTARQAECLTVRENLSYATAERDGYSRRQDLLQSAKTP